MAAITIDSLGADRYRVTVSDAGSDSAHIVTVDPNHDHPVGAEDLVRASFRFLLDREPKEAILPEFDLDVIPRYFPEYESTIGRYLE